MSQDLPVTAYALLGLLTFGDAVYSAAEGAQPPPTWRVEVHQFRIEAADDLRQLRLPALLLQPLVENAIKHGISNSISGGEVRIYAGLTTRNDRTALRLVVEDTGSGGSDFQFSRGRVEGIGLNSVEKRLQCYGGDAAAMSISSKPGIGTRVEIVLPVQTGADAEARRVVTEASKLRGAAFTASGRGEHASAREHRYRASQLEARLVDALWRETAAELLRMPLAA